MDSEKSEFETIWYENKDIRFNIQKQDKIIYNIKKENKNIDFKINNNKIYHKNKLIATVSYEPFMLNSVGKNNIMYIDKEISITYYDKYIPQSYINTPYYLNDYNKNFLKEIYTNKKSIIKEQFEDTDGNYTCIYCPIL